MLQHTFTCMFDGCEQSFETLRAFKKHITEDHKDDDGNATEHDEETPESPETISNEQQSTLDDDKSDESTCDSEQELESGEIVDIVKEDKKILDEKEKSALNALLMLSDNKPSKIKESKSFGNSPITKPPGIQLETNIKNVPVIPLLSPTSPKFKRKYPTATPVILKPNESSAKFYQSPKISNLTMKPLNSPKRPKPMRSSPKILGSRKRKLSEMDADGLAHLVLKLQDKVDQMRETMRTTNQQLVIVKGLYRKRTRLSKKSIC